MSESLPVEGQYAVEPGRWCGKLRFPNRIQPTAILIFALDQAWVGVRAYGPHEGYVLSDCRLSAGREPVCPRHGLPLHGAGAFRLTRRGEGFAVSWPLQC